MPTFVRFLTDLFEVGQVALPVLGQEETPDFGALVAGDVLKERDQSIRLSLAHTAPNMIMEAAMEGAAWLYQGCQLFVDRSRTPEAFAASVTEGEARWMPEPEVVYSMDLALSFLPDLHQHVRQHASEDPLMQVLHGLAVQWPLGSVGISDLEISWDRIAPWWDDRSLRQCYVDRVIAQDDASRLNHPEVAKQVRACLGERVESLAGNEIFAALY